jgi:hypothetical protein
VPIKVNISPTILSRILKNVVVALGEKTLDYDGNISQKE